MLLLTPLQLISCDPLWSVFRSIHIFIMMTPFFWCPINTKPAIYRDFMLPLIFITTTFLTALLSSSSASSETAPRLQHPMRPWPPTQPPQPPLPPRPPPWPALILFIFLHDFHRPLCFGWGIGTDSVVHCMYNILH